MNGHFDLHSYIEKNKSSSEIINASKQFPVQRSYNNKTHGMSNFPHKRQS